MLRSPLKLYNLACKGTSLILMLFFFSGCVALEKKQEGQESASIVKQDDQRVVNQIKTVETADSVAVNIMGNRKLTYTSVKQSFPLAVAVYLPDTVLGEHLGETEPPEIECISDIAVSYADEEETTAVVEILLKDNLDYKVQETDDVLRIIFDKKQNWTAETDKADSPPAREESPGQTAPSALTSSLSDDEQGESAVLSGIDFTVRDDGRSEIVVTTTRPAQYELKRQENNDLQLDLINTDIPDYRERPLVTKYFKSAVAQVLPVNRNAGENASRIEVTLRQQVPYQIVQDEDRILLSFEPSPLPPPSFETAKMSSLEPSALETAKKGAQQSAAEPPGRNSIKQQESQKRQEDFKKQEDLKDLSGQEKRYTGEKIRLDFFETDIKNVFRILQSVSGKNFAVDRDVTGNVTLTLEHPVPWDQVLDLVLKMNRLGQVQEGNIVRIATLETMKQEEELRQAALESKKRSAEQQKSLEPMETEYIPINYSNAEVDIRPHLEKLITPDRGSLSVDSRTNMIIMTDTRSKIDQAKELIYRLDKVTPQIMISAKVVEVSRNFSKKIGINWGMSSEDVYRSDLGGFYGFDVSMNHAVASDSSIGYTFSRITGTPFSLNATLTASEIKGDIKIVSSPRVLTLDNKKAKIKQGLEYAYLERDDAGGSSVEFKEIDLLLEVTPHVTPDKRIAMSVMITKNDIDSVTEGIPSLSTNEAETELLINDGNTIVIGGIVKTTISESASGFPFLSNIPGLGVLFGSNSEEQKKNELLIFITPKIVQLEQKRN
ncbi:MAG: type IV pilus secretin PilQ [Desulfobacteraceae bacterium]